MSAANWFVGVGLFAVAASLGTLAYRYERTGEVKKDREQVSVPTPPVQLPTPFGPVPHVTVNAATECPVPSVAPSPATVVPTVTAPTPVPVHKRPVRKHKAAKKLKSEWSSNEKSTFEQMKDMFK